MSATVWVERSSCVRIPSPSEATFPAHTNASGCMQRDRDGSVLHALSILSRPVANALCRLVSHILFGHALTSFGGPEVAYDFGRRRSSVSALTGGLAPPPLPTVTTQGPGGSGGSTAGPDDGAPDSESEPEDEGADAAAEDDEEEEVEEEVVEEVGSRGEGRTLGDGDAATDAEAAAGVLDGGGSVDTAGAWG